MLRYFRINDPYRLLGLLIIMAIASLPLFLNSPGMTYPELKSILVGEKVRDGHTLYTELIDSTPPLAAWFNGVFDWMFGRSILARHILALLIIFSQAGYLGMVFIFKKAFSENTFIPSLIFAILSLFSFDVISLSPELLGSGFLLLAMSNLFKQIEFREQRAGSIFNLGFYIAIASLFAFSFVVYLLASAVILAIFTRATFRSYLLMIFGFLLPHVLLMSLYYLYDGMGALWTYYYLPNLAFGNTWYVPGSSLWLLGALPLGFLVFSLIMMNRDARFTKYQSQLVQTMFFWMLFSFLQIFYSKELRPQSFITLIPSFCFFITHFLLVIRRKKLAEIGIWAFLITTVAIQHFARRGAIAAVHYENLFVKENPYKGAVKDHHILFLGNDPAVYANNTLATGFLNWELARETFEEPEFYDNVIQVSELFQADMPEVIIDPGNFMPKFFDRVPALKGRYMPSAQGLYTRIDKR
ncbi:glycosyltransferase family 39 protein [Parachryseolinea silvisoli]|uniref:glycosyltransferase family 39 protein n=1 Tax=Parachryseolinea silvisoli TaxID=2873601 RepID=UPI002265DCDB|nr:glycosyltransferase family 39 protein [Parachryseolinea silvisoli]MCD9016376.1 glycosyltransferase family 39 protein [Parachryseolinea silvisoli]